MLRQPTNGLDNGVVSALQRVGLELAEHDAEGSAEYLVSGNTFANRELLKRHGGRWSRERQSWTFAGPEPIRALAAALPANGVAALDWALRPSLADPTATFDGTRPSFSHERRKAQSAGHRNRLRQRMLEAGPGSLPDYELLELLLFFSVDVKDTKELAKECLARFGGLGGTLKADPRHLAEIHGLHRQDPAIDAYLDYRLSDHYQRDREAGPDQLSEAGRHWRDYESDKEGQWEVIRLWRRRETEILLKVIQELLERVLREQIQERPVIGSWTALLDYLQLTLAHEPIEQFRVLFLDRKNILIKDEIQQRGTVDHTPLYPREITKRALDLYASSLIMVHNHPSGDPTPSRADIDMTKQVVQALSAVGITVHDHVIVGKNRHTSFRSQRLF